MGVPDPEGRAPRAPTVAIVLPLYNGARFIQRTLDSVAAQTFTDYELIVVDDGSGDVGPRLVRERLSDPRVALALNEHRGIAGTRNAGLRLVSPDVRYVIFLDQDDLWHPEFLGTLVNTLERRSDAVGAFALADFVDADDVWAPGSFSIQMRDRQALKSGRLVRQPAAEDLTIGSVYLKNPVYPPSTLLIRGAVVAEVGGFSARYGVADDWDFVLRLARRGPLVPVDTVLVGYRRHGDNASGDTPRNVRETRLFWATAFHSAENSRDQQRMLRRIWRLHQRRTARVKALRGGGLLRSGAVVPGVRSLADAAAHLLLLQPPRLWLRYAREDAATPETTSRLVVERG